MPRKFYPAVIGGIFLILAGYVALWFYGIGKLERGIVALSKDPTATRTLSFAKMSRGGFPFRLTVTLEKPEVTLFAPRPLHLKASSVEVIAQPWDLGHVIVMAPGVEGTVKGGETLASLVLDGASVDHFEIEIKKANYDGIGANTLLIAGRHLPVSGIAAGTRDPVTLPRLGELILRADGVAFPGGQKLDGMFLRAGLNGKSIPDWSKDGLTSWRADTGTVSVSPLLLSKDGIEVTGEGTLALDADLRPEGAFAFRGPANLLTTWLAHLWPVAPAERARIDAALADSSAVMKRPAPLPVTLQGGKATSGMVELAELSPVLP